MARPTYTEQDRKALVAEFKASGLSVNAFVKSKGGNPSQPALTRWIEAYGEKGGPKGGVAAGPVNAGSILKKYRHELLEGRKSLERRKADLLAQVEGIDLEVMEIDEALKKLD
ncbi:hypothetical protein ACIGFL_08815 [Pseudomonas sp. NPDC077649]|uniref:hypothetical protein n=1 Tax=Pseudomonas sp. NPDC077649 TaxID=3364423 RepID=UPI0037CA3F2E